MPRMSPRPNVASAVAVLVATTQLFGQQSGAPPQVPTFRGGVELVSVDFLAVDGQGHPLPDLKTSELTLKVDGKPREVRSLQLIRVGSAVAPTRSSPAVTPLSRAFADNQEPDPVEPTAGTPRTVVFVVDHEHIRTGISRIVPEIVERFLDKLSAGDRAALVTMPNGRVEVDLTTELDRVRRMAANVPGGTALSAPAADYNLGMTEAITVSRSVDPKNEPIVLEIADFSCRLARGPEYVACMERAKAAIAAQAVQMARSFETSTRSLMTSLVEFLDALAAIDGPKTLVFISEGFVPFQDTLQDVRNVTVAAGRSRVQVYAIQPSVFSIQDASRKLMPKTFSQDLELQLTGLQDLSAATGGNLLRVAGTAENAVARIERETSAYYLLGFEPTPGERDGKSHTIDVRVQRAGAAVRSRPEFTIAKMTKPAASVSDAPASAVASPATAALMVRDDKKYRDLPMRALAYPFATADKRSVKVVVVVESPEASSRFSALAFSLAEPSGKTIAEWNAETAQLSARPFVSATMVPPGDYRLRVAAIDAGGRRGAVNYDFSANLVAAGSLHVGGLMLGVTSQAGAFVPRLLFGGADEDVTGYFEVYGAASDVSVAWELAGSPDGPALASASDTVSPTADADRFIARGSLPIISLAPGDYYVRASVRVNGAVVGRLSRALRKQ
jgi:VWFA-related protein